MNLQPVEIKRSGNGIKIVWSDQHESFYEMNYIRRKCPCVMCKGAPNRTADDGMELPSFSSKPLEIVKSQVMGRYAIHFTFNDGHDTGIYSFEHLRKICACPACGEKKRNS